MQDQRCSLREIPATLRADVWPFTCMCALVNVQGLFTDERLIAYIAFEDFLACVATFVRHQPSHGGQHRAAEIAEMFRRCLVCESVLVLHVPLQQSFVHEFLWTEPTYVLGLRISHNCAAALLTCVMRH